MVLHKLVHVDSQVSSVEATDANVDDSLLDSVATRVGWELNWRRGADLGEVLLVEFHGSHCESDVYELRKKNLRGMGWDKYY
jgi:hypothetical protein